MKKIWFVALASLILASGCREKFDRGFMERLVSMSVPTYNGKPVSSATVDDIRQILGKYQDAIQKKSKDIERLGRIYELVAQKYIEIESMLQEAEMNSSGETTVADQGVEAGKPEGVFANAVGLSLMDQGIYRKAFDYLQKAQSVFTANDMLYYESAICAGYIAKSNMAQGSAREEANLWYGKAEAYFKKAIDLNPENLDASYGYGILLLFELGRPQESVKYFLTVKEQESQNTNVRFALGRAYYVLGEYEQAIAMYDEILATTKIKARIDQARANRAQAVDARARQ
jgi:tetratricopeptide (TPR) repeat protein